MSTIASPLPIVTVSPVGATAEPIRFSSVTLSPGRNPATRALTSSAVPSISCPLVLPLEVTKLIVWPLLTPTPVPTFRIALPRTLICPLPVTATLPEMLAVVDATPLLVPTMSTMPSFSKN